MRSNSDKSRRHLQPGRLILASHNAGKLAELREWLRPFSMTLDSARELNLPEPEETGADFAANAAIKARAVAAASGYPALADDSGLEVDALGGRPGIFSARWAGPGKDFNAAMEKVLRELRAAKSDNRIARFVCALALAWPHASGEAEGECETFLGVIEGEIIDRPRGAHGFGYDAIFRPNGYRQTFAEMNSQQKQKLSHRSQALRAFAHACLPPRNTDEQ